MKSNVVGQEVVWLDRQSETISCTAGEDMCRQEYGLQTDIAYQVQRFGAGLPFQNGSVDFDAMDLTHALDIVQRAQQAWLELPAVVRNRYQSWQNVQRAAETGELQQLLKAAGAEGSGLPSAAGAAPSDSAAGE